MTIGEKIKYLRQKNDITQEKLAEYLNISYQSVSKWENNNAMPDIALVVPLANFFGVSIDDLFDRDDAKSLYELDLYEKTNCEYRNKGLIAECIALWRGATQKYPRNYHCLMNLANALNDTLYRDEFSSVQEENAKEVIAICERVLRDCNDDHKRGWAIQLLVYTYSTPWISIASEEKAVEYANMANNMYVSSNELLEAAYFTAESKEKKAEIKHRNILDYIDNITRNITLAYYSTAEERIFAYETAEKLWNTLVYDGNFLFYHCRLARICLELSKNYAMLGNRDKALENLKLALKHAFSSDNIPEGENYYTSVFINKATSNPAGTSKNYKETETELIKNEALNCAELEPLRSDSEFVALLAE